jgi:2-methylcitrate synthase
VRGRQVATLRTRKPLNDADIVPIKQLFRVNVANLNTGLRGHAAGATAVCTVGKDGVGLTYRGYNIEELAEKVSFEEVAYLLLYGSLPTQADLDNFRFRLKSDRRLPDSLKAALENMPANSHPMDVLRTGSSLLGQLEPETSFSSQDAVAERLLAIFPSMLLYRYHFVNFGDRISTEDNANSLAGHFLTLLHGDSPREESRRSLDVSLILYAEHEFNASTFAGRVCAATLSDFYSCVVAAIGALRGPLHGGANEAGRVRWLHSEPASTGGWHQLFR